MAPTEHEIAKTVSFISMLLVWMGYETKSNTDNVGHVENIFSLLKAILEHLGGATYLQSISFLWKCCSQSLISMEERCFAGMRCETIRRLALPAHCLPLTRLNVSIWNEHVRKIRPGFHSLLALKQWMALHYSRSSEIDYDIFAACDDTLLLLEAVAEICGQEL